MSKWEWLRLFKCLWLDIFCQGLHFFSTNSLQRGKNIRSLLFFFFAPSIYNSLSPATRSIASLKSFKHKFKNVNCLDLIIVHASWHFFFPPLCWYWCKAHESTSLWNVRYINVLYYYWLILNISHGYALSAFSTLKYFLVRTIWLIKFHYATLRNAWR